VPATPPESVDDWVAVRLCEPAWCPRYTARVVRGVQIGPSPDWMRSTLEKVGIRSINNVVDVTNYVMMEIGQPLHAFDYHLIARAPEGKPTILVRRAAEGELFTTLDGQARTLTNEMLLIADPAKGIALAGIMGGQNTEIHDATRDVLIEAACFHPTNIRRTSKALALRSESSYRFERGADPNLADWASRRAAQLIVQSAGGQLLPGVVDAYPQPVAPRRITLRHARVSQILGVEVSPADNVRHLAALGLEVAAQSNESIVVSVPTFRVDLKREIDLVEEVARLYGTDRIPATPPRGAYGANAFEAVVNQMAEARRLLTGLGLHEAQGQTLISEAAARLAVGGAPVLLANPLSSDMNALRPSLLPGLLDSLRHNLAHKNSDAALFELGRVFPPANGGATEQWRVAVALTGQRQPLFWRGAERDAKCDLHDLKGVLEEFLEQFGLRGITYGRRPESTALFLESALIQLGAKQTLGEMGLLLPTLARRYDLRDPVLLAELNLDLLLARHQTTRAFKALPAFPAIRRDVAMFVPEAVTHEAVLGVIKQAKPPNLEGVELFDVFRGQNVPAGQKSLAYALQYRHAERTLTDAEVNAAHERVVAQLKQTLGAHVRE
jgi:phenylalanyl-tRNA synthetase beta chain